MQRVAGAYPEPGAAVDLGATAAPGWLPSRVEGRAGAELVVAAPAGPDGAPLPAGPGDPVVVRWLEGRGQGMLDGVVTSVNDVIGADEGPAPVWHIRAGKPPMVIQRRHHERVPVSVPVQALVAGADPGDWSLVTLDVAEGGVSCIAPGDGPLAPDDRVELAFDLEGRRVQGDARVVRCTETENGRTVAFRFTGFPQREIDRLRRYLRSRDARRAGHPEAP